jgi:hypothetical protein
MNTCAALIAVYFSGFDVRHVDKTHVYEIPSSMVAQLSTLQRLEAKACALRYGIRYKVI